MKHLIPNVRMKIAAIKQFLRDNEDNLSQEELNELLEELNKYLDLLKILEGD